MKKKTKIILAVFFAALIVIGIAYAVTLITIPASVTIQTPASVIASPSSISFGTLAPGASQDVPVTLTNNGGTATGSLSMSTTGLSASVGTLTWDGAGQTIAANGGTLSVVFHFVANTGATDGTTNFSINISEP